MRPYNSMMSQNSQVKGTAARELHAVESVVLAFEKIEARHRGLGDVGGKFFGLETAATLARLPGLKEIADDAFGFAQDTKVRRLVNLRGRCRVRTAYDDRLAAGVDDVDEIENIGPLRQHSADHHQISPVDIGVRQIFGVAIDEAAIPRRRQHGRDRDETERRGHRPAAIDFADRLKTEEGPAGKSRRDQQNFGHVGHVMAQSLSVRPGYPIPLRPTNPFHLSAATIRRRPHRLFDYSFSFFLRCPVRVCSRPT
jgi:hypothetical protein